MDGWLFVYGTLRRGGGNDLMIAPAVSEWLEGVVTNGRLYHVLGGTDEDPIYPVARFDEEGTLVGDLLLVDSDHVNARAVHRMELGAGYEPQQVAVATPAGTVLAMAYEYRIGYGFDERIESGDWMQLFHADVESLGHNESSDLETGAM